MTGERTEPSGVVGASGPQGERAEQRVAALEARVAQQTRNLNEMAQGLVWLRSRIRAVAQDPVHGPVFRAALEDVLSRHGWEPGAAEEVLGELVPPVHNFSWVLPGELAACGRPETEPAVHFLTEQGVQALLSLELPPAAEWLAAAGMVGHHVRVPEYGATSFTRELLSEAVAFIDVNRKQGRAVAVHCHGGAGRTGSALCAYLVHCGATPEEAAKLVIQRRPRTVPLENLIAAGRRYLEGHAGATAR